MHTASATIKGTPAFLEEYVYTTHAHFQSSMFTRTERIPKQILAVLTVTVNIGTRPESLDSARSRTFSDCKHAKRKKQKISAKICKVLGDRFSASSLQINRGFQSFFLKKVG
ncbi:uncharacterized protein [Venturia canescens]|uniref:uncharacterized protein n=1 Tax=Venturia canescens TaxID=32260 RepID=UPI001C9C59AA|nr:uncharacterized protein LOC122406821 isoform X3 [Venturia canescens]XP_043269867.1 uncharacterized protein LOC122407603 isoform X3 [Venturia canescens]XP_043270850.1 uncharacterized protein LOC122408243 isoform X3 [Venturia canescens]XP_043274506.1 uncharacterized protein LOC122410441 isoform X3 [Venturia canescens]XP_043275875.1 uncharacterized protein LOC122411254 isoform X3 [Venturia canescens]XP_043279730.1 uncharacterized protein LOC122413444 isoform X3 [Venturia canescens]XP_04327987